MSTNSNKEFVSTFKSIPILYIPFLNSYKKLKEFIIKECIIYKEIDEYFIECQKLRLFVFGKTRLEAFIDLDKGLEKIYIKLLNIKQKNKIGVLYDL